eukprot:SAG22_NODE_7603_length_725_cov_0.988818_1_plen_138_part_00
MRVHDIVASAQHDASLPTCTAWLSVSAGLLVCLGPAPGQCCSRKAFLAAVEIAIVCLQLLLLLSTCHLHLSSPSSPRLLHACMQLFNFAVVPPRWRVVFVNGCMVGWNVVIDFMSQRAANQQATMSCRADAAATAAT